ncbi:tellurium resistance protein TerC [Corynebacterium striatum]|uniref:tellurium resistance protein TerC n=1 Tax=Corynebacterium striatum TaxID=43770 RepID=UPI003B5ADF94
MTSMFPGQGNGQPKGDPSRPGPVDYNRAGRKKKGAEDSAAAANHANWWPSSLRFSYWVLVIAAVIMLVSGMVGLFGDSGAEEVAASPEVAEYLSRNRNFVAISNIVCAIIMAVCSAQLAHGSKWSRRIITIAIAVTLFVNVAAMALGVGGLILIVIPVVLAVALLLLYRPDSNQFIREHNPRF